MDFLERDRGLLRVVGPWQLTASTICSVVGAGIFAVPAALAASVAGWSPLVIAACAAVFGAVTVCAAEGASRVPTSGGMYGVAEAAFGPLVGFVCGTSLWVSSVLACGGVTAALADTVASVCPDRWRAVIHMAVIVVVIGGLVAVHMRGIGTGARLVSIATLLKLVPLVVFVLLGLSAIDPLALVPGPLPNPSAFGRAFILAIFTFSGMETALCASGEVRDPARSIPRALAFASVAVAAVYIGVQVVAEGLLGPRLAGADTPLADAMTRFGSFPRALLLAGAAVSMLGWLGADLMNTPRAVFAAARDGYLPQALARVDPRSHVPRTAIICYAALALVLALTGTFAELAVLAALAMALVFAVMCVSSWKLARRGVALAGTPLGFRWLGLAAVIGTGSMAIAIALASGAEQLGLVGLIIGCLIAFAIGDLVRRRRVA